MKRYPGDRFFHFLININDLITFIKQYISEGFSPHNKILRARAAYYNQHKKVGGLRFTFPPTLILIDSSNIIIYQLSAVPSL